MPRYDDEAFEERPRRGRSEPGYRRPRRYDLEREDEDVEYERGERRFGPPLYEEEEAFDIERSRQPLSRSEEERVHPSLDPESPYSRGLERPRYEYEEEEEEPGYRERPGRRPFASIDPEFGRELGRREELARWGEPESEERPPRARPSRRQRLGPRRSIHGYR